MIDQRNHQPSAAEGEETEEQSDNQDRNDAANRLPRRRRRLFQLLRRRFVEHISVLRAMARSLNIGPREAMDSLPPRCLGYYWVCSQLVRPDATQFNLLLALVSAETNHKQPKISTTTTTIAARLGPPVGSSSGGGKFVGMPKAFTAASHASSQARITNESTKRRPFRVAQSGVRAHAARRCFSADESDETARRYRRRPRLSPRPIFLARVDRATA
jgi:hypothetical protein